MRARFLLVFVFAAFAVAFGCVENTQDSQDIQGSQDTQGSQDIQDIQDIQDSQDFQDSQGSQDTQDTVQGVGFLIPGPPCAVSAPRRLDLVGGLAASRFANAVATLPNGGAVAAGFADLHDGSRSAWFVALDGYGQPIWEILDPSAFSTEAIFFDGENVLLIGPDQVDFSKQRLIKRNMADGRVLFEATLPGTTGSTRAIQRHADTYLVAISQLDGTLHLNTLSLDGVLQTAHPITLGAQGSALLLPDGFGGQVVVPTYDIFTPSELQGGLSTVIQRLDADHAVSGAYDFSDPSFAISHAASASLLPDGSTVVAVERVEAEGQWLASEVHVLRLDPATQNPIWQAVLPLKSALRSARVHIPPGGDFAFVTGEAFEPSHAVIAWRVALSDGSAEEILNLPMPEHPMMSAYPRGAQATTQGLHLLWTDSTDDNRWQLKLNHITNTGDVQPTQTLFESALTDTQECVALPPFRSPDGRRLLMAASCVNNPELGNYVQLWFQQASCIN